MVTVGLRCGLLLFLAFGCCTCLRLSPRAIRTSRSMRARHGRAALKADGDDADLGNFFATLFKTNRNSPEAVANQLEYARQQMDLEVPDETLEGTEIADREDFIEKYITSEKSKFGREVDRATAEAEVDEWLLRQATYAPAQTTPVDLVAAGCVFIAAFGTGIYFASQQ